MQIVLSRDGRQKCTRIEDFVEAEEKRPTWDSNPEPLAPETSTLTIAPAGHMTRHAGEFPRFKERVHSVVS